MAYTKNTWNTGDTITADKLNHMEDGIAGGTLVIGGFSFNDNNALVGTSDKTWQEIDNAFAADARCIIVVADTFGHTQVTVEGTAVAEGLYSIYGSHFIATTPSADGYPTAGDGSIS